MIYRKLFASIFYVTKTTLSWWAQDELNTLGNVTGQALVTSLEQLLLVVVGTSNNVVYLLRTFYAKLGGDGEEVTTCELLDLSSTLNTWEVDKGGLDDAALTLGGPDDLLCKSVIVSVAQHSRVVCL